MAAHHQLLIEQLPHLRRYARVLLLGRAADADDLVHDTLERALAKWGLWRGKGSVRPWLFSIMHNLFVDQCALDSAASACSLDDLPDALHPVTAPVGDVRLEALELIDALGQLPVSLREVLLLVCVEELSYADVARALSIPTGTVMSRLSRARTKLWQLTSGSASQHRPTLRVVEPRRNRA